MVKARFVAAACAPVQGTSPRLMDYQCKKHKNGFEKNLHERASSYIKL